MELLIVSGMSGAGKSRALQNLEDMGYYCVDNLPPQLLLYWLDTDLEQNQDRQKTAVTIDIRSEALLQGLDQLIRGLDMKQISTRILFLDASDETLRHRYRESRRLHPLIQRGEAPDLNAALAMERERLSAIRQAADIVVDTTHLQTGEFRQKLRGIFSSADTAMMSLEFVAFGFKYGILADADLVFDVRCLPNPFYVEELRPLTGDDAAVREYLLSSEEGRTLYAKIRDYLEYTIPLYMKEGKNRLVVGLGCTGGQHRSLAFAGLLREYFEDKYPGVTLVKRDVTENRFEIYQRALGAAAGQKN